MKYDLGRALVESTVSRALRDMETDSHRTARRLVDLGLTLSRGNFEKSFFTLCRQVLADEQSPYYQALEKLLREADRRQLVTFGVNVGYESCSRGAKEIRAIEQAHHFNVPWAIDLAVGKKGLEHRYVRRVVAQAQEMGVRMFFLEDCGYSQEDFSQLFSQNPTCDFILMTTGVQGRQWDSDALREHKNLLVSVDGETPLAQELCAALRDSRLAYCIHLDYESGEGLDRRVMALENLGGTAVILRSYKADKGLRHQIYERVKEARTSNESPMLLLELPSDLITIDNIVSSDPFYLTVDGEGVVWREGEKTDCNVKTTDLFHILSKQCPKKQ